MNRPSAFYTFQRMVKPGLAQIAHPTYGTQHWKRGEVHGSSRFCAGCNDTIVGGAEAWRPFTHAGNRADRLCASCMIRMTDGASAAEAPKKKPSRRDLLVVIGRLQDMFGEALARNNDRNPERQGEVDAALNFGHQLCIEVRAHDPPLEDSGPWSTKKDPRDWTRCKRA